MTEEVVELAVVKPLTMSVTITREVTPQEIENMMFGTGALTWQWWRRMPSKQIRDGLNGWLMRFEAPDDSGTNTRWVSEQGFVDAAAKYLTSRGKLNSDERDACEADLGYFDAVGADNVMQVAVFGSVVFS